MAIQVLVDIAKKEKKIIQAINRISIFYQRCNCSEQIDTIEWLETKLTCDVNDRDRFCNLPVTNMSLGKKNMKEIRAEKRERKKINGLYLLFVQVVLGVLSSNLIYA